MRMTQSASTYLSRSQPSLVRFSISFYYLAAISHIISSYYYHFVERSEKVGINSAQSCATSSFRSTFNYPQLFESLRGHISAHSEARKVFDPNPDSPDQYESRESSPVRIGSGLAKLSRKRCRGS